MDTFAGRIRSLRGTKKQDEFAQELGIHKNTLGRWERGQAEPDVSTAQLICTMFGVSPYWLLAGQGPMLEKDREIKVVATSETTAGEIGPYRLSEVSGGPEFDTTMAALQARLAQVTRERDDARAAELKAKDEALKAKDQALEAMQRLAYREHATPIDEDPPTDRIHKMVPSQYRREK